MTTGPDGERRQEPTFADVMNGFGLDSGRPVRRRLFGRRRGGAAEPEFRAPLRPAAASAAPVAASAAASSRWRIGGGGSERPKYADRTTAAPMASRARSSLSSAGFRPRRSTAPRSA
jgi:hypothetical protein